MALRTLLPVIVAALLVAAVAVILWMGGRSDTVDGAPAVQPGQPADRQGALVDEVIFTQETDPGRITALIERGSHHLFTQGINSPAIFRQIQASPHVDYHLSRGTVTELTLNPAPFEDGRLNPFQVPAVREAMNWLVDRRYIAEELFGGLARPRYLPLSTAFPDYARLAETARELEIRYRHDPVRAEAVISREMEKLGAERVGGRWHYRGAPVELIVLIRTEDLRERVGDDVANRLEDLGFRVRRLYRTADEASRIWIATDPSAGGWHVYTGGWISTVINRDAGGDLSYYYTPRGRPDPLWQAYDPDPAFAALAERLDRRDYRSLEEREALMIEGLRGAMKESYRIWLVDQESAWPHARNLDIAVDLAGGVSGSALWPYTLRFHEGLGGRVVVGTPSLLTEPWNPVAGSNWIFDQMILRSLNDAAVLPDPFTGLYWPQRLTGAEVTVAEDAPVQRTLDWVTLETAASIPVPEDAWIDWDAGGGRIVTVGEKHPEGVTARSRTVLRYEDDYLERRWHDGSQVSLADMILPWILVFERADEQSPLFDPGHLPPFEVYQRHFRGWRIVDTAPLTVEVYSDQIFPDAEVLVANRTPGMQPWHVLALGMDAERFGELAFSSGKADRTGVEWMNLVSGPSLEILRGYLTAALASGRVPHAPVLGPWMTADEPERRYAALQEWHRQRGHFWVGDGPFRLHSVRPVEGVVVLRRYEDFPDRGDKWLRFTEPRIPEPDLTGPLVVEHGEAVTLELALTFTGEPYPNAEIDGVRYLLFDGDDRLAARGDGEPVDEGRWHIRLPVETLARLGTGANSLEVAITTDNVALPVFVTHAFATVPSRREAVRREENPDE